MNDAVQSYDLIVIGAGPGGYVAAIRASQLGMKTAIVERAHLGGICLNWGCIPTKALLRSAEVFRQMRDAAAYGLRAEARFDAAAVFARSRKIAAQLNQGVEFLLKKNKVDAIWGQARIERPQEIRVAAVPRAASPKNALGPGLYKAKRIIVATGARPRALPGLEPDGDRVWTYFDALGAADFPKSLLIVGAGAIGVEFASFFNAFGVKTTLIEAQPRILPAEDAEIAALMRTELERSGVVVHVGAAEMRFKKSAAAIEIGLTDEKGEKRVISAERALSAVGVVGNCENLGLEALGVKIARGCASADEFGRTAASGIYVIGDAAGPPMLAHKAEHEAVACVERICGLATHGLDKARIPCCVYAHPQIASVGVTEAGARASGLKIKVGRFPFSANGKAIAMGEPTGFVKTIFEADTGRLLGAHLIGPEVSELIHSFVIAMTCETTEEELMSAVFPHPTLSEALQESVFDAYGRALHK